MKIASVSSLLMLLLGTAVHQTQATCTIKPLNKAFQGLTVDVYDGLDGVCWDSSSSGSMDYDTCKYYGLSSRNHRHPENYGFTS